MLKDEVKKRKDEYSGDVIEETGGCRFCGQIANVEVIRTWSKEQTDEIATEMCTCLEAHTYTNKKEAKEKAYERIDLLFGQEVEEDFIPLSSDTRGILYTLAEAIIEGKMNSVSIELRTGLKAKMGSTSRSLIKVERIQTKKDAYEA